MCSGPSRPPRLRPQGFSPSRRFPRRPGLHGLHPPLSEPPLSRPGYMPLPCRTFYFPFKAPPAGIAHPFRGRWLPRRSARAAFECDPSCPDLPGLPPTPASFRPTFTRSAECDLVRPRVRQTSAQWPVSLQGSSDVSTKTGALDSSSPAGTAYRAHPRVAPSTSERSSSRVPDPFPGVATGSWIMTLVGLSPPELRSGSSLGP